jgi:hypothetical protein
MDEIDAAVEDAEYVRATRDCAPRPVKSWEWMSGPALDEYISKLSETDASKVTLEAILADNLGFYQVILSMSLPYILHLVVTVSRFPYNSSRSTERNTGRMLHATS